MSSATDINVSGSAEMGGGDAFGFAPSLGLRDAMLANAELSRPADYGALRWMLLEAGLPGAGALPAKTPPFFFNVAEPTARAA